MQYKCTCCGEAHDHMQDLTFDQPEHAESIAEEERDTRVILDSDLCAIDKEHFFIRAVLLIPILESEEHLGFGVWISQEKAHFANYLDNYDTNEIGPFIGNLANELKYDGVSTLSLEAMVHFQGSGQRPLVVLDQSDHPLYLAQENGIAMDRAWEIIHDYLG